jgi:hypothetical protein
VVFLHGKELEALHELQDATVTHPAEWTRGEHSWFVQVGDVSWTLTQESYGWVLERDLDQSDHRAGHKQSVTVDSIELLATVADQMNTHAADLQYRLFRFF